MTKRTQFFFGVISFVAILIFATVSSLVLESGSLLVPFAVFWCVVAFVVYRCLHPKDKKDDDDNDGDDDDDDLLGVAVAMDEVALEKLDEPRNDRLQRVRSTRAMAALNQQRTSLESASEKKRDQAFSLKIPNEWEEFLDEESGQPFFFNESTGQTTWRHPSEITV